MGKENCVFANKVVISAEFIVLHEYLNASGFIDCLNKAEILTLAKELYHTWLTFQSIVKTLRNSGESQKICYFVDDSFTEVNYDSVYAYVQSCPGLYDYKLAAKYAKKCCDDKVAYANKLRNLQINELEQSALFQIFAIKTARQLFGDRRCFKQALSDLFKALQSQA